MQFSMFSIHNPQLESDDPINLERQVLKTVEPQYGFTL